MPAAVFAAAVLLLLLLLSSLLSPVLATTTVCVNLPVPQEITHLAPCEAPAAAVDGNTEVTTRCTPHKVTPHADAAAAVTRLFLTAAAAAQEFGCVLRLAAGGAYAQLSAVILTPGG